MENTYNECNLRNNNQSLEESSVQIFVKTTIQILYDKCLIDGFPNAIEVLKDFLYVERRRLFLEKVTHVVQ